MKIFPQTSSQFHQNSNGNDRRGDGFCFKTKAQLSVEASVDDKESTCANEMIGLKINEARPHDKLQLPHRGAWLWVGSEMIHLMELPNPDPLTGRPQHGGRDRRTCICNSRCI